MILLSIDPGVRGCGCALWENGQLLRAAYVVSEATDSSITDLLERARAMARSVAKWVQVPNVVERVVLELPQTYGGTAAKGDANDLIALAVVDGALAATFSKSQLFCVTPREWKGNAPKEVTTRRVLMDLSDEEAAGSVIELPTARSLQHNVFDAVAIGLWWLKKHGRRK